MKETIQISLTVILIIVVVLLWGRVLYKSAYGRVLQLLETPEDIAEYCSKKFEYVSDIKQFGKADYWLSGRDMFYQGQGDCEDFAFFIQEALAIHGYSAESWHITNLREAHMVVVFFHEGQWTYMDCGGFHEGYSTKQDAINGHYGANTVSFYRATLPK